MRTCRPAANACDVAETCDGAGNCPANATKAAGTPCGDSSDTACTDPDTCDAAGVCQPNHSATTVVCRPAANACDVAETCDGAGGCPANAFRAAGTSCGDSSDTTCTDPDSCDGSGTCRPNHAANTVVCRPAANACDVAELCDGAGGCPANALQPAGTACGDPSDTVCDNPDRCDAAGVCQPNYEPSTTVCRSSGGQCDVAERCTGTGTCPANALAPNGTPCNDGNACTGPNNTDACQNGTCGGPSVSCNDGNTCTDDSCDATVGCRFVPDDTNPCNDGNACTVGDHCTAGACAANPRDCSDGLFCNGAEGCNAQTGCTPGTPPACGDAFACTTDTCDETLDGCLNTPDDAICDDDNQCTIDACIGSGGDTDGCSHDSDLLSVSDSRAYGLSVKSLGLFVVAPSPDTDDAFPSNQLAQISAPPLATVELLTVSDAATSDANGASASATAQTAKVQLVASGATSVVTAKAVKSTVACSANGATATCSSAGSVLTGVKVLGQNLGNIVNPTTVNVNTVLLNLTVRFFEQIPSAGGVPNANSAGLTVNAIHVFGTIAGGIQPIDIVVAHAEAEAAFGDASTCEPAPHVSGEAFVVGLLADEDLIDPNQDLVDGKALHVVLPAEGGNLSATQATVGPLGYGGTTLVSSATATSHTEGVVDGDQNTAESSSYAQVEGLRVADAPFVPPLLGATLVRAECGAMADGGSAASTGDSTILGLSLLGVQLCDALNIGPLCEPAPNTDVLPSPLGTLIRLNEQRCDNGGTLASGCSDGSVPGATGITVNAIHVYVLAFPNPLGLEADLVVSSAHCDAAPAPVSQ